jgi:hypothetical protein
MDLSWLIFAANLLNGLIGIALAFELIQLRKRARDSEGKFSSEPTGLSIGLAVTCIVLTIFVGVVERLESRADDMEAQARADEQKLFNEIANEWQSYEAGLAERDATASIALDGVRAYFDGIGDIVVHTSSATSTIGAMIACTSQNRGDDGIGVDPRYREFLLILIDGPEVPAKAERTGGHRYAGRRIREQQNKEATKLGDILGSTSPIAPTVLQAVDGWMSTVDGLKTELGSEINGVRALAIYQELKARLEVVRKAALEDEMTISRRIRAWLQEYSAKRPSGKPK